MTAHPDRKPEQPFRTGLHQQWLNDQLRSQHAEALYGYGELAMFTMMWKPDDYAEGLVARCSTCFGGVKSRQAAAFKQPTTSECPDCYGTTFEGGFRAQVLRPALFGDSNLESNQEARGFTVTDTIQIETTPDILLRNGDYVFRFDNRRYQVDEKVGSILHSGFGHSVVNNAFSGSTTIHLEDPTSVAYKIPPTDPTALMDDLSTFGDDTIISEDLLTPLDLIAIPGGYLS